jgi:hypothetical protein
MNNEQANNTINNESFLYIILVVLGCITAGYYSIIKIGAGWQFAWYDLFLYGFLAVTVAYFYMKAGQHHDQTSPPGIN